MSDAPAALDLDDRQAVRAAGQQLLASFDEIFKAVDAARRSVADAVDERRAVAATARLDDVELDRLKDVTDGALRLGAIEDGGITSVGMLLRQSSSQLVALKGVGPATAKQAMSAAIKMRDAMAEHQSALPDSGAPDASGATLLRAVHHYQWVAVYAHPVVGTPEGGATAEAIRRSTSALLAEPGKVRWLFTKREDKDELRAAAAELATLLQSPPALAIAQGAPGALQQLAAYRPPATDQDLWADYAQRGADYAAALEHAGVGGLPAARGERVQGGLSAEIADRCEAVDLDCRYLGVSLRGYQEFGIKFVVAQQRVILGDEMGLGKTIQALGAMTHFAATEDAFHFLVVSPATITQNWMREIASRSSMRAFLLHGPDRQESIDAWIAQGGVGVTSFETLKNLGQTNGLRPHLLVVDEAHYVKNPSAARTKAVKAWTDAVPRVLYMSGTPLENRLSEFTTLVSHVSPAFGQQLVADADGLAVSSADADQFRERVSPVYLRRNQEDVLAELPERIEMEEWIDLNPVDETAYRNAVAEGNIMGMRQAATIGDWSPDTDSGPPGSAKFLRLADVLEEYLEEGRKVLVFSFFRKVLTGVERLLAPLGGCATITGDVSPEGRMQIIDEFTAAPGFQVIASQIEAGGVGLNLQAASVVVLMEPQLKPSTEAQAIARAHRMGQTRKVVVHRLLARDAVDESLLSLVHNKQALFDTYARNSALKDASVEATDLTETSLVQQVIATERQRLGLDASAPTAPITPTGTDPTAATP